MIERDMEKLARSLAGHDKDRVYVVVKEDDSYVYLADGKSRTLKQPKKKKRRHVQLIMHLPDVISETLGAAAIDSDLVHVLRLYNSAAGGRPEAGRSRTAETEVR